MKYLGRLSQKAERPYYLCDSTDKKLAGAAKTSFETKCVKDAVGNKS